MIAVVAVVVAVNALVIALTAWVCYLDAARHDAYRRRLRAANDRYRAHLLTRPDPVGQRMLDEIERADAML